MQTAGSKTTNSTDTTGLVTASQCLSGTLDKNSSSVERRRESNFGADDAEEPNDRELEERPISIVPAPAVNGSGSYDVSREYGYKYEYTQDQQDGNEDEDEYTANLLLRESHSSNRGFPLHQTTAVITKSQERIPYIHILGKTYHPVLEYQLRKEFEKSLFWFTYRCDFPEIAPYKITSDAGWGCMLRSAQMLLAHSLRVHFKSKYWKAPTSLTKSRDDAFVTSLMSWFADFPSTTESVYSLHNMVAAGFSKYEVLPGEWYGPKTACQVLRDLVTLHQQTQPSLFRVHVSAEGTVYREAVHKLMTKDSKRRAEKRQKEQHLPTTSIPLHPLDPSIPSTPSPEKETHEWDTSLLLLVPLRLGLDKLNEDYVQCIAKSFGISQSVGILGGRPRGARWFYGAYADGSKVLGLDPHTIQVAPQRKPLHAPAGKHITKGNMAVDLSDEYMQSVHTAYPEVFPLHRMDPSLAIGFYCRDKKEFTDLEASLKGLTASNSSTPELFTFADNVPDYLSSAVDDMMLGVPEVDDVHAREESDDDEYVLL